jgi:molybdate transport system ATP-binding protein
MSAALLARFVKRFNNKLAVEAEFQRPTDRFSITVLFGPSGCGKTTTLRCLAGLERPEAGRIDFEQQPWFDAERNIALRPQQRDIGYLFQEYALFPHLTVAGNIAYGLRNSARQRHLVADMLDLFHLGGLEGHYPSQISGGEQQRVALARVLVRRPRLLLLDEPLSALDQPTREQLRTEMRRLLADFGIPVVLVTHERIEAMTLADHLIVLDQGKIRQQGTVEEVFNRPADVEVARIVGMGNVLPGEIMKIEEGMATVAVAQAQLLAVAPTFEAHQVYVNIRPEDVILQKGAPDHSSPRNRLHGTITTLIAEGPLVRIMLDCGFHLQALITRNACTELELRAGDAVTVMVKAPAIHLLARCHEWRG